jgi:two-component system, LytTR family, sensor kinase
MPDAQTTPSPQTSRFQRLSKWLALFAFWTSMTLVYSTRMEIRGDPIVWIPLSWLQSFKVAAAHWYSWAILSVPIFWINRRLPVGRDAPGRRLLMHVPLSLLFIFLFTYLHYWLSLLIDAPFDPSYLASGMWETFTRSTYRFSLFIYWAMVTAAIALDYQEDLAERKVRGAELERLLSEARLSALRAQLDPHLLFNALNTTSALVERDPRAARQMLEHLGDLLRLSLENADVQEVSLDRELVILDRYVQLQLARFGDRIDIHIDVPSELRSAIVPVLVLQPLVENAIRHGVSKRPGPGRVEVKAIRAGDRLHLSVQDDGPGLPTEWHQAQRAGIGLSNTRERLRWLYGDGDHAFTVGTGPLGGAMVEVDIRWKTAA